MESKVINETRIRSITKALTWRVIGAIVLASITWFITHNLKQMTLITIIFEFIQIFNYYIHERIWNRIHWGVIKHPLSDINLNKPLVEKDKDLIKEQLKNLGYLS